MSGWGRKPFTHKFDNDHNAKKSDFIYKYIFKKFWIKHQDVQFELSLRVTLNLRFITFSSSWISSPRATLFI